MFLPRRQWPPTSTACGAKFWSHSALQDYTFEFHQSGNTATAKITGPQGPHELEAKIKGDNISFTETQKDWGGNLVKIIYGGKISADGTTIKFMRRSDASKDAEPEPFVAYHQAAAAPAAGAPAPQGTPNPQ